jgi:hypothetical protein
LCGRHIAALSDGIFTAEAGGYRRGIGDGPRQATAIKVKKLKKVVYFGAILRFLVLKIVL